MKKRNQVSGTDSGYFMLPPGVSCHKQALLGALVYVFRHHTLGELGRVVLRGRTEGGTHIVCQVAGHPADPMTSKRAAIFRPLGLELAKRVAATSGPPHDASLAATPPGPAEPKNRVGSKIMRCPRCGAIAVMLIFAPDATDEGRFEDYVRVMYLEYKRLNLPTWIIGPDLAGGQPSRRPGHILKIWPEREPLKRSSAAELNTLVHKVISAHCGQRQKYANN